MDPLRAGTTVSGIARASLHIYEPGDECASDTLPTVADLLASADPQTGVISIERYVRLPLRIDASALSGLSPESRVGPGSLFVTHEALAHAALERNEGTTE
jgi:hypothetical protein